MRKIVFLFLFLIVFACGQKAPKEISKTNKPVENTSIKFKEEMHNFGKLTAGEIVLFSFEFTNTGSADYQIENTHSDCGCVTIHFNKEPIKPGDTGIIEVEYNTAGLVGKEFKTIEIDGNSKELKHLAIFADVKNEIIDIKY